MKSLKRRFAIEEDKRPLYSTLVNFGHAIKGKRYGKKTIVKWFYELVDKDDYDRKDRYDIIDHMLGLSNSEIFVNRGLTEDKDEL